MADVEKTESKDAGAGESKPPPTQAAEAVPAEPPAPDLAKLAPAPIEDWLGKAPGFAFALHLSQLRGSEDGTALLSVLQKEDPTKWKVVKDASDAYGWGLDPAHLVMVLRSVKARGEALNGILGNGYVGMTKPKKLKSGVIERSFHKKSLKETVWTYVLPDDSIIVASDGFAPKIRATLAAAAVPPPPPVFESDELLGVYADQAFLGAARFGSDRLLGAVQSGYVVLTHKGAIVGRGQYPDGAATERALGALVGMNLSAMIAPGCAPLGKLRPSSGRKDGLGWFKVDDALKIVAEFANDPACRK